MGLVYWLVRDLPPPFWLHKCATDIPGDPPFDTKGRMLRLGKINVQGGFHFTFRCKILWSKLPHKRVAPENKMVAHFPYNNQDFEKIARHFLFLGNLSFAAKLCKKHTLLEAMKEINSGLLYPTDDCSILILIKGGLLPALKIKCFEKSALKEKNCIHVKQGRMLWPLMLLMECFWWIEIKTFGRVQKPILFLFQGGSKALVGMALDGTEKGMRHAAQALSRIGITQDPKLAFPGNRVSTFYL